MSEEMRAKLATFIAAEIIRQPARHLTDDEPLISSGLIDSFHLVDLALFIEDHYAVRIDETELNADCFDNLAQLLSLVQKRLPA